MTMREESSIGDRHKGQPSPWIIHSSKQPQQKTWPHGEQTGYVIESWQRAQVHSSGSAAGESVGESVAVICGGTRLTSNCVYVVHIDSERQLNDFIIGRFSFEGGLFTILQFSFAREVKPPPVEQSCLVSGVKANT
jgi:hypothetical protein